MQREVGRPEVSRAVLFFDVVYLCKYTEKCHSRTLSPLMPESGYYIFLEGNGRSPRRARIPIASTLWLVHWAWWMIIVVVGELT